MSWRRKLGVSIVFALGLAACTASIVHLSYTVERAGSSDLAYHLSSVQLTVAGEGAADVLVKNNSDHWHVGSSSENHLVPLEQMPSVKSRQHDLELGNIIVRSTEFRANEHFGFDPTIAIR
ncbi:hypothetical protein HD806DRAFT_540261 [Xylariaceae sp. AK1471]|nr:hypothetical protein HD806DRAFT_540261 [Xylariaceae sp. AK1471]